MDKSLASWRSREPQGRQEFRPIRHELWVAAFGQVNGLRVGTISGLNVPWRPKDRSGNGVPTPLPQTVTQNRYPIPLRGRSQEVSDHDLRFHTGQALVEPLEAVREAFMVDTHAMQDGRVDIVDRHRFVDGIVAKIVGLSVDVATANTATGHPHAEISRMMIAAVIVLGQVALGVDGSAEFSTPHDQC